VSFISYFSRLWGFWFAMLLHITVILFLVSNWHVRFVAPSRPFSASKDVALCSATPLKCYLTPQRPESGLEGFVVDKAELGIPPIAPPSLSSIIIRGWYNRPVVASVRVDSVPLCLKRKKNTWLMLESPQTSERCHVLCSPQLHFKIL
jgi:hypothetical protein